MGVQPIQAPVGLIYHMRYRSGDPKVVPPELTPPFALPISTPTFRLEVTKAPVEAKSRKLQASFGPNNLQLQDLKAHGGLDLASELIDVYSDVIIHEIYEEMIDRMFTLGEGNTIVSTPSKLSYIGDQHAVLGININQVCGEIARKTRRGAGNFIITSPLVVAILQSSSRCVFAPAPKEDSASIPSLSIPRFVGTLNGSIKVYAAIHSKLLNKVLVGYKGRNGDLDAGLIYAPYIPLMVGGPVVDPTTFQLKMSMMTRYGISTFKEQEPESFLGNSEEYYGVVDASQLLPLNLHDYSVDSTTV